MPVHDLMQQHVKMNLGACISFPVSEVESYNIATYPWSSQALLVVVIIRTAALIKTAV